VADALHALGFAEVADARGRAPRGARRARRRRRAPPPPRAEMCERLLANPVTEDYVVEEVAPPTARRPGPAAS
jgi:hypothetical protein